MQAARPLATVHTSMSAVLYPLTFEPVLMERVWGGRRLEALYGKPLPSGRRIGESWEIVDRPEAQSVVRAGACRGRTLHELWVANRQEIFGTVPESPRFPLLIKLLDASDKLSLQVHPPPEVATELGGEAKTEFWYIADAAPRAEIYVGLTKSSSREEIREALEHGTLEEHVHRVPVQAGDAMFLPSGRMHAVGAGLVIVEIQQNSDTTYRVFDWNRPGTDGRPRELHIEEALRSIDFTDCRPDLIEEAGELLVRDSLFEVERWSLDSPRAVNAAGSFAIVACLSGELACAGTILRPGEFFLVPACLDERELQPRIEATSLLRVTLGR